MKHFVLLTVLAFTTAAQGKIICQGAFAGDTGCFPRSLYLELEGKGFTYYVTFGHRCGGWPPANFVGSGKAARVFGDELTLVGKDQYGGELRGTLVDNELRAFDGQFFTCSEAE